MSMVIKVGDMTAYDVEDLSKMFRLTPITIRQYIREGRLPGRKFGKRWYVLEEDVKAALEKGLPPSEG